MELKEYVDTLDVLGVKFEVSFEDEYVIVLTPSQNLETSMASDIEEELDDLFFGKGLYNVVHASYNTEQKNFELVKL